MTGLFELGGSFIAVVFVKATIVLALGSLIAFLARSASASVRHGIWAMTLAVALGLPLGVIGTPKWNVAMLPPAPIVNSIAPTQPKSVEPQPMTRLAPVPPSSSSSTRTNILTSENILIVWGAGAMIVFLWMFAGRFALAHIRRRAFPVTDESWKGTLLDECNRLGIHRHIDLLSSPQVNTPITWGVFSPVIVVPAEADEWNVEHRRVVLRHELAHIARGDQLTQMIGAVAGAVYWFNPLAWIAMQHLRAEQERACDDSVLVHGTAPADYAAHLLEVARSSRALGMQSFVSLAMARPTQLEGRLLAVLNSRRGRRQMTPAAKGVAFSAGLIGFVVLSAFTPIARTLPLPRAVTPTIIATQFGIAKPSEKPLPIKEFAVKRADSSFVKTLDVTPGGTLDLDLNTGGSLTITGWDRSEVEIRGRLGGRDWESTLVMFDRTSSGARLRTRQRTDYGNTSTSHHFDIRLPSRYNVRVQSSGGSITINDMNGDFTGTTGGGAIRIDRTNGRADLSTGGGAIRVTSSNLSGEVSTGGGTVVIQDVNGGLRGSSGSGDAVYINSNGGRSRSITSIVGDVRDGYDDYDAYDAYDGVVANKSGGVTVGSGGNVTINESTGEIRDESGRVIYRKSGGRVTVGEALNGADIRTGGGSVTIGRSAGSVIATTGGGDITIGPLAGSARVSTGAGDVRIAFKGVRNPSARVMSGNGQVVISVPSNFVGTLDLETAYTNNLGRRTTIRSDFPLQLSETSEWDDSHGTPRRFVRARQSFGSGGNVIRVQTVNGDIIIRKE